METIDLSLFVDSSHPPEELIERYAMKQATAAEEETVEEHLFGCHQCREALVEAEQWVGLMKQTLPAVARLKERPTSSSMWLPSNWLPAWRSPAWGLGAAALAVALIVTPAVFFKNSPPGPAPVVASVILQGFRGPEAPTAIRADSPLDLRFVDPDGSGTRIHVVREADGTIIWSGRQGEMLAKGLPTGMYWVRLLDGSGKQIQEAGLRAQ